MTHNTPAKAAFQNVNDLKRHVKRLFTLLIDHAKSFSYHKSILFTDFIIIHQR